MFRWGILGVAEIAGAFARGVGLSGGSCIGAIASRDKARADRWALEHKVPLAFGSYEELLGSGEVDALYNPLPNSLHAEWTIRAVQRGIPVLCEKPLTANAAQAREVIAEARGAGVNVAEAFMYRFHPMHEILSALLAEGAIGEPVTMRSSFSFVLDDPGSICLRDDLAGGSLLDVGCYCVNLSRAVAGCEPDCVSAFERRESVDRSMVGCLRFPGGFLAHFECGFDADDWGAVICGTKGRIFLPSPWLPGEDSAEILLRRGDRDDRILTPGANCYQLEAEDFAESCRMGKSPKWPVEDALANMKVIDALFESARECQSVELEHG